MNYWWVLLLIIVISSAFWMVKVGLASFKRRLIYRIHKEVRHELEREFKLKKLKGAVPEITSATSVPTHQHQTFTKRYDQVTVLFADIQGFTKIVEHLNPEILVDQLDHFFFKFDEVVERLGIEKIKTIGDAYMCAGGLPISNRTNPVEVVLAALEMQQFMKQEQQIQTDNLNVWELRIGIHTGPVISGMVGRKKINFDIWGDSVNIASRMESSGVAGEINITGVTYQYVRDFFDCQYRGKMPIKYKGETDMYFVKGIAPQFSENGEGKIPNSHFMTRLQHIRFGDLEEFVLNRLETELNVNLLYHNKNHTVDVLTRVEVIARGEEINDSDLLLLKTAALLHDTGFLIEYRNHEQNSVAIAREILPRYKYTSDQIDKIVELINVTKPVAVPSNLLEMILKDADLDYLGRSDYIDLSHNLYLELVNNGKHLNESEWLKMQYDFIYNHKYYTNTGKRLRQVNKVRQLDKMRMLVDVE